MRRQRGEVEEEGLLAVLLVDQLDRLVADQRGVVAVLLEELAVALPVDHSAALAGEVIHFAHDVAVEMIEARGSAARYFLSAWPRCHLPTM